MIYEDDDDECQLTSDPEDGTLGDLLRSGAKSEAHYIELAQRENKIARVKGQKVNDALNKIMEHLDIKLGSWERPIIELDTNSQGVIYGYTIKENKILSIHCDSTKYDKDLF